MLTRVMFGAYLRNASLVVRDLSGEPMRPHDEVVRVAIEQSLGNTLQTMLTPSHGLFVRKPELWKATLQSLGKWSPGLAEQLRSTAGLQPIATVSSVETDGTPEGDAATAVVTAVVLEEGVGVPAKDAGFQQPSLAATDTEEDNCSIQ